MGDPVINSMIASCTLDSLVMLVFIFRLWIRVKMQRVGWEDIWAIIAFLCGMLNVSSNWTCLAKMGAGHSPSIALWIYMFSLTCLIWAVRISIIFSILRIVPAKERLHSYGLMVITFFSLTCLALIAQRAVSCMNAYRIFRSSSSNHYFTCTPHRGVTISELTVGFIADIITVAFPLYVLRRVALPPKQLRLLRILFSSSIVISITCSLRTACQIVPTLRTWVMFITDIQIAICLTVCNLLIVTTYLYCLLRCRKRESSVDTTEKDTTTDPSHDTPPSSLARQMTLTTVELLFSGQSGECMSYSGGSVA